MKASSGSSGQVPVGYRSKPAAKRYSSGILAGTSAWHFEVFFESSSGSSGQVPVRYRSKPAAKRYSSGTLAGTSAWHLAVLNSSSSGTSALLSGTTAFGLDILFGYFFIFGD